MVILKWYYVIIALVPLLPSYEQVTISTKNIGPVTVFDYRCHIMGKKRNHIDLRFKETNNNILNILRIKLQLLAPKYQRSIIHMKIQTSPLENGNSFLSKLKRGQRTNLILSEVERA